MTATFEIRSSFGLVRAYPTNDSAQHFCNLTGSKTLLRQSISTIEGLGFTCKDQNGQTITAADLD